LIANKIFHVTVFSDPLWGT